MYDDYIAFLVRVIAADDPDPCYPWIEAEARACGLASGPWKHSPSTRVTGGGVPRPTINDPDGLIRPAHSGYSCSQNGGAKRSLPSIYGHQVRSKP